MSQCERPTSWRSSLIDGDRAPVAAGGRALLGSALPMSRDVLGFLTSLERDAGPVAAFRIVNRTWVLVSHADGVDEVLVDRERAFEKPDAIYGPGRLLFGNSLTGLKGEVWRTRRRLVAPAFHRLPVEDEHIVAATHRWLHEHADGPAVRLDARLTELMLEVAATNLVRVDPGRAARLAAPISSTFSGMSRRMRLGVPAPDWLPIAPVRQMRAGAREITDFVDAEAARPHRSAGGAEPDLLAALLTIAADPESDLDARGARDEVAVSMAVGGHQMATALTWTLFLLAEHPEERERLRVETDEVLGGAPPSVAALPALAHAARVIEESMRLYPPFYLIGREALEDTTVAGHDVPKGATVVLSPWVTHRLERYYEDPAAFHPSRWAPDAPRPPRGAFFPTGGGGRLCVAQAAMRRELLLVLVTLLQHHDVVLTPGQRGTPLPATSLAMRGGLTGRLTRAA